MQQSMIEVKKQNNESGVFLLELALVIIVLGFAVATSVPLYNSYIQRNALIETEKRIDIIAKALSSYSQTRFRVPCPADPTPVSTVQYGVERAACAGVVAERHGIIPYRTLGIPEQYAKDAYGNFFTYVVSQDFTTDNRLGVAPDNVHLRLAHLVADDNYALLPKAQFCAPINFNTGSDIAVQQDGNPLLAQGRDIPPRAQFVARTFGPNPNASRDIGGGVQVSNRDINVTAVAVAIISHGANKYGSYQSDGSQFPNGSAGASELVNIAQDNNIQTEFQVSGGGGNDYDDIVKFYTQDEIYAESGGNSCEHL